jgi:hypothetical protein
MKPKVLLCGGVIALSIISCIRKENLIIADIIEFESFATEFHKTAQPAGISVEGILSIAISEGLMVATTMNPNALISIIDIDMEKVLFEGGTYGRGPNDFITLTTNNQLISRSGHICFWVRDRDTRKSVLIDIIESVEKQIIVNSESWQFGRVFQQMNGMLVLPTGERFVKFPVTHKDARDDIRYYPRYLYFSDDKEIKEVTFFKCGSFVLSESNHESVSLLMFDGVMCLKPDGTKAIDAFYHADHLNFIDLIKNRGFSVHYSKGMSVDEIASAPESYLRQNYVRVHRDATVTDDYVFALYSGNPDALPGEMDQNRRSAIRIFDWNGNPLSLVHVDKELKNIAYDQRTKKMYALDFEENILYYELDDVI